MSLWCAIAIYSYQTVSFVTFTNLVLFVAAEFKPYKSAYAKEKAPEPTETERYYCEVCAKDFNGPRPYEMHLNSKNHKEEVENAAHYN